MGQENALKEPPRSPASPNHITSQRIAILIDRDAFESWARGLIKNSAARATMNSRRLEMGQ